MICPKRKKAASALLKRKDGERGFTLIEITIALVIMMVVMLGAASLFAFSTLNNSNGADRAQTLAVAQETMETLRRLRFSTAGTDPELSRPTYTQTVYRGQSGSTGRQYNVVVNIADTTPTVKTISINVTPVAAQNAWTSNTSWATVSLVTQRAMSDQP
jgi:prepilin-type N-terminal cleavage/methylation domain-containing protein